jgi:hypothetical protein
MVPITDIDASKGANLDLEVDALTAKYRRLALSGTQRISLEAIDGFDQTLTVFAGNTPDDVVKIDAEGVVFDGLGTILLAVSNGNKEGSAAGRIKVRKEEPTVENNSNNDVENNTNNDQVVVDEPDDGGCSSVSGRSTWIGMLPLLFLFGRRRRR